MLGIFRGQRPDITPAQAIAGIPVLGELAHAFGIFTLSAPQQDSLEKVVLWAFALVAGDAAVRIGRNVKDGKVEAAALTAPTHPAHDAIDELVDELPSDAEEFGAPDSAVAPDEPPA